MYNVDTLQLFDRQAKTDDLLTTQTRGDLPVVALRSHVESLEVRSRSALPHHNAIYELARSIRVQVGLMAQNGSSRQGRRDEWI